MNRILLLCSLTAALAAGPAFAGPRDYVVHPGSPNQVVFTSSATVETFHGKTRALDGRIHVDPEALGDSAEVHFEVDLATLHTGLPRRDQHMRENHLEIAKYPKATFDGVVLKSKTKRLEAGTTVPLEVEGTFGIHGVRHRLRLTVETTLVHEKSDDAIRFKTTFPIALADYAIPRPQFLFLKLAEVQQVTVQGVARSGGSGPLAKD